MVLQKTSVLCNSGTGVRYYFYNDSMLQSTDNSVRTYEGYAITFQKGENLMVNATQMAKAFGKQPSDWMRQTSTDAFLTSLSAVRGIPRTELIRQQKGGISTEQGTWMHEDVALEFARWLSPKFAIWCNDRIKELLREGVTTIANDDEAILHAMQVLQKRVDEAKLQLQALEGENELLTAENKALAPKAQYTDEVLQSTTTFTLTQVAKSLGFRSVNTFTKALQEKGILYRQSGQWMPRACFAGKGYFATRTARYFRSDGSTASSLSTVITEKGRAYLNQIFNNTTSNNKNN